jgi:hypothetical protein
MPVLCTLVVASAFDAAIHDAWRALGVSCYETHGPRFMRSDLSVDLGPEFKGEHPTATCRRLPGRRPWYFIPSAPPSPRRPMPARARRRAARHAGRGSRVTACSRSMKPNGGNMTADVERIVRIDRVVTRVQASGAWLTEIPPRLQRGLP